MLGIFAFCSGKTWPGFAFCTGNPSVHIVFCRGADPGQADYGLQRPGPGPLGQSPGWFWNIIHALGSNTKARFEHTKMLRSNDGGLTLYAMLYAAWQTTFRNLSAPVLECHRCIHQVVERQTCTEGHGTPCSMVVDPKPSTATQAVSSELACESSGPPSSLPHSVVQDSVHQTCRSSWSTLQSQTGHFGLVHIKSSYMLLQTLGHLQISCLNPSDPHWVLAGSLLQSLVSEELAVIAEGSLLNKVFPSKKEYHNQLRLGLQQWTKRNGLPSLPRSDILELCQKLWSEHSSHITCHITKSTISQLQSTFEGAIFHCEDKL